MPGVPNRWDTGIHGIHGMHWGAGVSPLTAGSGHYPAITRPLRPPLFTCALLSTLIIKIIRIIRVIRIIRIIRVLGPRVLGGGAPVVCPPLVHPCPFEPTRAFKRL